MSDGIVSGGATSTGGEQPAAQPEGQPASQPASQPTGAWFEKPEFQEITAWAKTRGYDLNSENLVAEALKGQYNSEKLIGLDRAGRTIVKPKEGATPEEFGEFYNQLGRPATPEEYKIPTELKGDPVAEGFAKFAHENGYLPEQFEGALKFVHEQAALVEEQQAQEREVKAQQDVDALKSEWGQEFELRAETSRRAARELGLSKEETMELENALGVRKTAELFFQIGKNIMEPTAEGITGGSTKFGMSKGEAQGRIQMLKSDKDFSTKLMNGDASAKAEWDKLNQIAYG